MEQTDRSRRLGRGCRRGGNAFIEFALSFVAFLALIFALFDLSYVVFVRGTLHHAVREGVRYAITGAVMPGMGHDDSVKEIVRRNAIGLLNNSMGAVNIEYFLPACTGVCSTAANNAGNIVVVSVNAFAVQPMGPLLRASTPFSVTVAAVDKMEPFPGAPPPRTLPTPPI